MIILLRPGGVKALIAENIALRQQLITLSRRYKRSPKLNASDRIIFGLFTGFINSKRSSKIDILIKPATLLKFHKALVQQKYHLLYSNKSPKTLGPKGPSDDIITEMKYRNPSYGYLRIAMQLKDAFGINLDEGVIRRQIKQMKRKLILFLLINISGNYSHVVYFSCQWQLNLEFA